MARDITVTFDDGSSHVYRNAPDTITFDQALARAKQDFSGRGITNIDGGRKAAAPTAPVVPPAPMAAARPLMGNISDEMVAALQGITEPASAAPVAEAPVAEEPGVPYKNRVEALDDAVNLLEEGAPKDKVRKAFGDAGIPWNEIIAHGKARGSAYFQEQPVITPRITAPAAEGRIAPREVGTFESVVNAFKRADTRLSDAATAYLFQSGVSDAEGAGQLIARNARRRSAAAPSDEIQAGMQEIGTAKTFGDAASAMLSNPRATFTLLVDSVLTSLPAIAPALVLGPAGAVVRGLAAGAGSGGMEYGAVLADALSEKGVDLLNSNAVAKALSDPQFIADVKEKGAKRGLIVGVFDGLSMGLAGRFLQPARELVKTGKLTGEAAKKATIAAWGKELAVQVGGGAGGEAAAQAATGEYKPADILLEGLAEGVTAPLEARSVLREAAAAEPRIPTAAEMMRERGFMVPPEEGAQPPAQPPATQAQPPAQPLARVEPTLEGELPPTTEARIEPTAEAPAAPPTEAPTEATVRETDEYKRLFAQYRKQGMTKEDADGLARRAILGAEAGLEYVPPVNRWPTPMLTATLQQQLAKPEGTRNEPLTIAIQRELAKRGVSETAEVPTTGAPSAAEPISEPSGVSAGVAGEPSAGAPAEGVAEPQRTGVVPAGQDVTEPAAGEGREPVAVTPEQQEADQEADQKARTERALDVAKSNISTALDTWRDWGSVQASIDAYRDNVADTLREQGETDQFYIYKALDAFDRAAEQALAKEGAPSGTQTAEAVETTQEGQKAPAAGKPRGRPKAELTTEELAEKESQKKKARADYTKADRNVKKAVATLDATEGPLDESQFDNDTALAEAEKDRVAARRTAIRSLLQLQSVFRGTALGNRIKEALSRPSISEQEKANISEGIKLLDKQKKDAIGPAALPSTDPNAQKVNPLLSRVTNAAQALSAIAKTGNAFQKLVANRLRRFVANVPVIVVEKGAPLPEGLRDEKVAAAWEGARGLFVDDGKGNRTIYLRGASFGADQGVNNVTTLHEIWHAATNRKLSLGLLELQGLGRAKSDIAKFTREMTRIMAAASAAYADLDALGDLPAGLRAVVESTLRTDEDGNPYYAIFDLHHEFLAYGMSDPEFQEFLNSIETPEPKTPSLYSRFIAAMREALGIPASAQTALTGLISASNSILSSRKTPWMRKIEKQAPELLAEEDIAAQNRQRARRINQYERKILRSREAQDVVDGLGALTALKNPRAFLDTLEAAWSSMNTTKLRALLPALPTDTIVQWGERRGISGLKDAWRNLQDMAAMRTNMLSSAADMVKDWLTLQPGALTSARQRISGVRSEVRKLSDVMHYSTDKGVDPTVSQADPVLNRMWSELTPKAKEIYVKVRDSYKGYFDLYRLLLDQRIANLTIPGQVNDPDTPKGRVMAEIKKLYETGKAISPYFPLMRYGQYWLSIGKGRGKEFYMFESEMQRELFLKSRLRKIEASGQPEPEVKKGNDVQSMREYSMAGDTSQLLKDIFAAIDSVDIDAADGTGSKEALKDQIYQLYLTTMPEQTFRNQFIHRKGTAGYSGDAVRNFITSTLNMSNQLSRLKYGPRILMDIERARESLEGNPARDKLEMFVNEMGQRARLDLFPSPESPFARSFVNIANRTAFLYYMTSVKTALSQFASLPVFGVPVLMSRHNPAKVLKEMSRFMNVFTQFGTPEEKDGVLSFVTPTIETSRAVNLSPDEMKAVEAMRDSGLADVTLTYDLMDRKSEPTTKYIGAWKTGTNIMGSLFHNVERLNREVMFMTSFRLNLDELHARGVQGDAAVEAAVERAIDDTYTALGNFTEGNRPRIMRGSLGRLILQFKMFPTFLTVYMARNFYRMLPYLNKEGKKEAATQFFGTLGMSYLLAGYVGIPGITFAFGALQGLLNMLKDEEDEDPLEKKDLEMWFRSVFIPSLFGEAKVGDTPVSEFFDAGVLNAISGYDMNSSLSMNNIWFPELKESATYQAEVQDYALSLAGPTAGLLLKQVPGAMDDFRAGKFYRGTEKLMPNLIRQPMVAYRYSQEGVTTPAGDVIKDKEEFTRGQLVMQALGYRTEGLASKQTANYKANAIRREVMNEKNRLIARLDLEATQGSDEAVDKALENVLKFNSRYPMLNIKGDDLNKMLKSRIETRAKADRGFRVDKKFYPYLEELLAPSSEKLQREAAKPEK